MFIHCLAHLSAFEKSRKVSPSEGWWFETSLKKISYKSTRGIGLGNRKITEEQDQNVSQTGISAINMANFPALSRTAQR